MVNKRLNVLKPLNHNDLPTEHFKEDNDAVARVFRTEWTVFFHRTAHWRWHQFHSPSDDSDRC